MSDWKRGDLVGIWQMGHDEPEAALLIRKVVIEPGSYIMWKVLASDATLVMQYPDRIFPLGEEEPPPIIMGGRNNTATGYSGAGVFGGMNNDVIGGNSFIGGGILNKVSPGK